ncbi:MAG: UbiA family prenyltransferase [Pseudomonadota bacterium]
MATAVATPKAAPRAHLDRTSPLLPLVFDLDGTLVRSDLTLEMLALCLRWRPALFVFVIYKFCFDKAAAKHVLAGAFADEIDVTRLPYEPAVVDLMRAAAAEAREVSMVSGSDHAIVQRVAAHLKVSAFKGSEPGANLTGHRKAAYLREKYGEAFEYVGNSAADCAVWRAGRRGYAVRAPAKAFRLRRPNGAAIELQTVIPQSRQIHPLIRSLRPHQWAKNLLIFVVPALQIANLMALDALLLVLAFICFCALTSGSYLLNDVLDIPDDRRHAQKSARSIPSGQLGIPVALAASALLIALALFFSFRLNPVFGALALLYLGVTLVYSLRLKRVAVFDVFTLASLYSIRVIAGAYLVSFPPTGWLMTFTGAFFLSLAIGKRYVEVKRLVSNQAISGRGYLAADEAPLLITGAAIGTISVLALLMYGFSAPVTVFQSEMVLLCGAALLMAWVFRFWLLAGRGEISDDPVEYAVTDQTSLMLLGLISMIFAFDLTGPMWQSLF